MGTAISDTAAIAITTTTAVLRNRCLIGYLILIRRLAQMAVDQLFGVLHTLKLQLRRIPLQSAIKRKTYLPGFRKRLWVLDCRFVINNIRISQCKPLCDLQGIAMEVAGSIKPCLLIITRDLHDESVSFPATVGPTHPRGDRSRSEEHTSELQSQSNLVCRLLL